MISTRTTLWKSGLAASLACFGVALAQPARAETIDTHTAYLIGFLQGINSFWGKQMNGPTLLAVANGSSLDQPFDARAGVEYEVTAICEAECSGVKLELIDAAGETIDDSIADLPDVSLEPEVAGTYTLRVSVSGCKTESCNVALVSFEKKKAAE